MLPSTVAYLSDDATVLLPIFAVAVGIFGFWIVGCGRRRVVGMGWVWFRVLLMVNGPIFDEGERGVPDEDCPVARSTGLYN